MTTTNFTANSLEISERELNAWTSDVADAHEETRDLRSDALESWADNDNDASIEQRGRFSRRSLFGFAGASVLGVVVAGVELHGEPPAGALTNRSVPVDIRVAALAASLENLAVATYGAGLSAATKGQFGKVPPAFAKFAITARAQHVDHAAVWNHALTTAGYAKVTKPDPKEQTAVNAAFAKVKTIPELAQLALLLENIAAATYLEGLTVLASPSARMTAASIQPVEMQHVAILRFVLGETPVPSGFASTALARPITDTPFT